MSNIFTSESVSNGHPDKIADQISDAVLDACLEQDPNSQVNCEVMITREMCFVSGTISSKAELNVESIAKEVIESIGYTHDDTGFNCHTAEYIDLTNLLRRDPDSGVAYSEAGSERCLFGYACDETAESMPLPIQLAHEIMKDLVELRQRGEAYWLRPHAKSQVSVAYRNGVPVGIDTIILSTQHIPHISVKFIEDTLMDEIVLPIYSKFRQSFHPKIWINPAGQFTEGGPSLETGFTGRKIVSDSYGGRCPQGSGAFSGKDASKLDRSGAYAARWIAKHIVATGLTNECTVQLFYAHGKKEPLSINIDANIDCARAQRIIPHYFDLSPDGIKRALQLNRPIYSETTMYGHFGKPKLPWEQLDSDVVSAMRTDLRKVPIRFCYN